MFLVTSKRARNAVRSAEHKNDSEDEEFPPEKIKRTRKLCFMSESNLLKYFTFLPT